MENWTLWHVGLSVKNVDEAVKYYESLGGKADDRPAGVLDSARFKDLEDSRISKPMAKRMLRLGR